MNKNKKGFTLIELIASIGVVAVIILMATISYTQIRKNILQSQYNNLKVLIEQTGVKYASKSGYSTFFVQNLIDNGMLETDDATNVYDPRDKSILNCHILTITEDDNGNLSAKLQKEDHTENNKCKVDDIDVYNGDLTLSAVLNGTSITYPGSTEVKDPEAIYPRITLDGWTNEQIKITAVLDNRVSEAERQGGRFVWNKDTNLVTEYPNNTIITNATGVVNQKYFVDFYNSNGDQYQANMVFKFDKEAPVIYQEENNKPRLASGSSNTKWSRSKTVIMYVTDKDGVGVQRIYIGKNQCSNLKTDASLGQPAVPGMIQTVTVYDQVGTTPENYHICAIDKLGNVTDAGTIPIAMIDNSAPDVEEKVYVYNSTYAQDASLYTNPLATLNNSDIDIANYHTGGWTATGHFYLFKVSDVSTPNASDFKVTVKYTPEDNKYRDNLSYSSTSSKTVGSDFTFHDAYTAMGKRKIKYDVCDKLGNCKTISITNDNVDKTKPETPQMNFIYTNTNGEVYDGSWTYKTLSVARSTTAAAPTTTDLGSGVARYEISEDNATWQNYSYDGNSSLYRINTEGNHARYFRAIDKVGNISGVKTVTAKLDKTKPTIKGSVYRRNTSLPNNMSDQLEAERTFTTDGNFDILGLEWKSLGVVLKVMGSDSLSGVKSKVFTWDKENSVNEPTTFTGKKDVSSETGYSLDEITSEGFRVEKFTVTDNAGNSTVVSFRVKIDITAPYDITDQLRTNNSTGAIRSNTTNWTKDSVWWGNFGGTDKYSGIKEFEYNSGPNCTDYAGVLGSTGYIYGGPNAHYAGYVEAANIDFCIRAVDNAGNRSAWKKWTYIRVDKKAPTVESFEGGILHTDTHFASGNNGIVVYNNSKNGTVTHTRTAGSTPIGGNYFIRIKTAGAASPGLGGFYFADPVSANKEYISYMYAKIPTGYTLEFASNGCGTNPTYKWITSHEGTGNWKAYIHYVKCGSSGTFANTNFYYLNGPAATSSKPVTWDLEYATTLDPDMWAKDHWSISYATDEHSKLASYKLTRDSNDIVTKTYSAAGSALQVDKLSANKTFPIVFTDTVGNSTTKNVTVTHVDRTGPVCGTVTGAGSTSSWTNGDRSISVACSDAGIGCTSTSFSNTFTTGNGTYRTVDKIQIKDKLGNTTDCSVGLYIDKIPPTCGTVTGGSTTWTNGNRTVSVACSDSNSGCAQSSYSATYSSTTKTANITIKDKAGNTKACSVNAYVDKTKPTLKVTGYKYKSGASNDAGDLFSQEVTYTKDGTYLVSSSWLSHGMTMKFVASDADSGIKNITTYWDQEYSETEPSTITGGPSTTASTTKYQSFTGEGWRKVKVIATDNAGNTTTVIVTIKIAGSPTCRLMVNTGEQLNTSSSWYTGTKLGLTLTGKTFGSSISTYKTGWTSSTSCDASSESGWDSVGTTTYDVTTPTKSSGRLICGKIIAGGKTAYCSFRAYFDNRPPVITVKKSGSTTSSNSFSVSSGSSVSFTCDDEHYQCKGTTDCFSGVDHGILSYNGTQVNTTSTSVTVTSATAFNYKCYDKAGNMTERTISVSISGSSSSSSSSNPPSDATCTPIYGADGLRPYVYHSGEGCPSGYHKSSGSYQKNALLYGCNPGTTYIIDYGYQSKTVAQSRINNTDLSGTTTYANMYRTSTSDKYTNKLCTSASYSSLTNCSNVSYGYYRYYVEQYSNANGDSRYRIIRRTCSPKMMSEYVGDANQSDGSSGRHVCCKN